MYRFVRLPTVPVPIRRTEDDKRGQETIGGSPGPEFRPGSAPPATGDATCSRSHGTFAAGRVGTTGASIERTRWPAAASDPPAATALEGRRRPPGQWRFG